jgi:membrane protein involved in colicin uptake
LIIFFFTGSLIKNTVISVLAALVKKEEEKSKRLRQLEKEKNKESDTKRNSNEKGRFLDIKTNDEFDANTDEEEFNALPVADFIKKELK